MANIISPKVLRGGLEIFAALSLLGFAGLLFYSNNLKFFLEAMVTLKCGWVVVGVGLASLDWFGGGIRIWILTRHVHPKAVLKGSILAGGLNTWASYLTPSVLCAHPGRFGSCRNPLGGGDVDLCAA
jgi:hypothetical protein